MITHESRILVVDDFAVVRLALKRFLADLSMNDIEEAADGAEALHKLKEAQMIEKPFHLVFSDWSMPKMNGLELIQECRKIDYLKNIPIVLVTAEGDKKQVLKALNEGVSDYVVKPFSLDVIKGKIEQINQRLSKK